MLRKGGYILRDTPNPELIMIASGSEVHLALAAASLLEQQGRRARIVNLASWELFSEQPEEYRLAVLPPSVPRRLGVEAASGFGWERWLGDRGRVHGVSDFGHSAPWKVIASKLGFTPEAIADKARNLLAQ